MLLDDSMNVLGQTDEKNKSWVIPQIRMDHLRKYIPVINKELDEIQKGQATDVQPSELIDFAKHIIQVGLHQYTNLKI